VEASPENCFVIKEFTSYYLVSGYRTALQFGFLQGSHNGIGPDRGISLGTAAYANVPTRPTNRSNALSERFIDFLLRVCRRLRVKLPASSVANYTQPCNFLINRRLLRGAKQCDMPAGVPNHEGAVRQAIMTAVYADFLSNGLK
jgi:hypothetical protein